MTSHQSRRDEVDDILAMVPDATPEEADALVALFSAAAGPALTGELKGEAAAVAAFRAAQPVAAPSPTARFRAAVFTVKAAVAALAVTSVGGVALAATTDVLPAPLTIGSHSSDSSPSKDVDNSRDSVADAANAVREAAKSAAAADRADAKAGRERSYAGLCQAFTAGAGDNAKAAANPAFARLVAAAPDGNVTAFCSALAAEAPAAKVPPGKAKSTEAREKAAENAKSAEARENGKAAEKTADKGKPATTPAKSSDKAESAKAKRNSGTAEAPRNQPSL